MLDMGGAAYDRGPDSHRVVAVRSAASNLRLLASRALLLLALCLPLQLPAQTSASPGSVVLMHGLAGSPSSMRVLADALTSHGFRVASLHMAWAPPRHYDVSVDDAEREVLDAFDRMHSQGAAKRFVVGFSKGGTFAGYVASRHALDGLVLIAPAGGSDHGLLLDTVAEARRRVADGRGQEPTMLDDIGMRGRFPVRTTAAAYLSWIEPEGALDWSKLFKRQRPNTPIMLVVPTRDRPAMVRGKQALFDALPPHPLKTLYEPESGHGDAVEASTAEVVRWLLKVSGER